MLELKPADVAKILGKSVKTIQRWDNDGILVAKRNPKGRRCYTMQQVIDFKKINGCTDVGNNLMVFEVFDETISFFENLKNDKESQMEFGIYYSLAGDAFLCSEETYNKVLQIEEVKNNLDSDEASGSIYVKTFIDFLDMMWADGNNIVLNFGVGAGRNPTFSVSLSGWGENAR